MRVQCDVLLYAGHWGVSRSGDWRVAARQAIVLVCRKVGRFVDLEFTKAAANDDGLRVVVQVTADVWCSADALADSVCAALVTVLRPEFESQVAVEASDVVPTWESAPSNDSNDDGDTDDDDCLL